MNKEELLWWYDEDAIAFRWGQDQAVIVFDPAVAIVTRAWDCVGEAWVGADLPSDRAGSIARMIKARPAWECETTLGELLAWASRRSPREEWIWGAEDHAETIAWRRARDYQRIGPATFDRGLVRESIQHWVETRTADTPVAVAVIDAVARARDGTTGHALRIRVACSKGREHAIVAGAQSEGGDDPWAGLGVAPRGQR
jgi:hypothetical protein